MNGIARALAMSVLTLAVVGGAAASGEAQGTRRTRTGRAPTTTTQKSDTPRSRGTDTLKNNSTVTGEPIDPDADRLFTGTYRLDAASAPDVVAALSRAITCVPASVAESAAEYFRPLVTGRRLVLHMRGNIFSFRSPAIDIVQFIADGKERTEKTQIGTARYRAVFESNGLSTSFDFENGAKFLIAFEPSVDGQYAIVNQRFDITALFPATQPLSFQIRYNRTSESVEWDRFKSR
jgi:hypothetical protein